MRKFLVDVMVLFMGAFSVMYVLNFGFGMAELIPDNVPLVGNLDEAGATALLLACLSYFGVSGGKFVNMLRVLAGRPPLRLSKDTAARPEKE